MGNCISEKKGENGERYIQSKATVDKLKS